MHFYLLSVLIISCQTPQKKQDDSAKEFTVQEKALALEVIDETRRTWEAYKQYAWGQDVLTPLSKSYIDWYDEPLYISPIDAYSTLFLMGLKEEAKEIDFNFEEYIFNTEAHQFKKSNFGKEEAKNRLGIK
jgi:hypothetical protein